ncbi:MAG: PTS sugar transporter subunit IIA [Candidatus Omnitrophota bacterium]
MKVTDYLVKERVALNLSASNKKEAINQLGLLLRDSDAVTEYDQFIADVFKREALTSTGVGHFVAIPHARTNAVNDFIIAFGRISEGIEFDAIDKKPVKLVFLMGTPEKKGLSGYMKILASLSRRLEKEDFREALLKASSAEEVINEFKKFEV